MNKENSTKITLQEKVTELSSGKRLDQAAALLFPDYSRSCLQRWIKDGQLTVDGVLMRQRDIVTDGQVIKIDATLEPVNDWLPQDFETDVKFIYQDNDIIVVDKPAGLVTHPAVGNRDKTLLNILLHNFPKLKEIPRAGIVHRLDKDTSGLLIVAHSLFAHTKLINYFKNHEIEREYEAIVVGRLISGGCIDEPVGRHPTKRTLMAVVHDDDRVKPAITHYRVLNRFGDYTHVGIKLDTGRTHQIRVHFAYIGHPVVGDKVYGGRLKLPKNASENLRSAIININRQALHARKLTLIHPRSGKKVVFTSNLPNDIQNLLDLLAVKL